MGFFNSKSGPVWKDANGKITCPGNKCRKVCDNTCPIFLKTQADELTAIGSDSLAAITYADVLRIAPEFGEAWNNRAGHSWCGDVG